MSQNETIKTPQDYVNYTFNIEARGVAEVSSELVGLSNTVGNILGQLAFKTSEFLNHTDMLAIGTGAAISALFTSATQDAIHFQQQVANVQAIGGESINASSIGDAAIEYSNKFGMATSSMTEGLEALARAGITTTQVMSGVLEEGVKLSKLEGMDLEDSINDLIATTNLLALDDVNMNDLQYANMVREMNQHIVSTSESAPINAQNIIQTLQHVGGYASASGMDQDDLFAVIAQLGSRGTKGEMAGTALRAFIAAGQKDTAQRALARIGLNVRDLWSESGETMLPISEMKQVLDDALEARGYSKQEKLEFYSDFAGYKQANQIMKIDTSEVEHYKEKIANAWDLGQKLDTILGTVRGNLDRIYQTTANFMQKVGSKMLPVINAFLVPLRTALTVFTKIPFMDTAFAATALFITFRTGLMLFNKLVPAVAGFMSGISDSTNETRGLRTEWTKTREEIEQAKNIMDLIRNRDQEGLTRIHYETHGLSAANQAMAEDTVAGQMYMASDWYKDHGRIPWQSLGPGIRDMIIERFKPTQEFKTNYNEYVNRSREAVNEIVSEPVIITEWENKDTLEAINVYVQEIFNLLNGNRTQGTTDNTESNRERNRRAQYVKTIMDNNHHIYADNYGHYGFNEYFLDAEEGFDRLTRRIEKTYKSLQMKLESFDNASAADMDRAQRKVYKKALFREAMTPEGRQYAEQANKSDVVLALERGQFNDTGEWYRGITDAQIKAMANAVNIDLGDFNSQIEDNRQEYIERIHNALNAEAITLEERQRKIQQITDETTAIWQRDISASDRVAIDPGKILENNANIARDIVRELSIHTTQGQSDADAIKTFFLNEANRNNEELVNKATNIMFTHLKQAGELTSLEQDEVKYVIENLQRLQNTLDYFNANNIHTEFKDEMSGIKEIMAVNTNLFRVGGRELGEAIEKGFVEEGLGRHSPGYLYHAVEDELDDIEALLKTRVPNVFNQASTALKSQKKTFASKGETIGQAIDYILEDIDVLDYFDVNDEQLRKKEKQDTRLLKTFEDGPSSYANFIYPYGTDMSNVDRYGFNFPISNMTHLFNLEQGRISQYMPDAILKNVALGGDKASGYLDALIAYWTELHQLHKMGFTKVPYSLGWTHELFLNYSDMALSEDEFNDYNEIIELLYRNFINDSADAVNNGIAQSKGFKDPVILYRAGRMPGLIEPFDSSQSIGVFRGITSLSSDSNVLSDFYKPGRRKMKILVQPGVKNITADYSDNYLFKRRGFDWERETTIGNKQMFITYNPPGVGSEFRNQRLVLLTSDQTEYMNSVIRDEDYHGNTFKSRGEEPLTEAKSKVFDSGIQYLKRDSDTIQEILSDFDPDLYDDDEAYRDDMRAYQSESQKGYYSMSPLSVDQRHMIDIFAASYGFDVAQFERFGETYKDTYGFEAIIGATLSALNGGVDTRAMYDAGFSYQMIDAYENAMYEAWSNHMDWDEFTQIGYEAFIRDGVLSESDFDSMSDILASGFIKMVRDISTTIQDMIRNSPGAVDNFYVDRGGRPIPVNSEGLGELFGSTSGSFHYDLADMYASKKGYNMPMEIYIPEGTKGLYLDANLTGNHRLDKLWENQQEWLMGSGQAIIQFNPMNVTDTDFSNQDNMFAPYRYLALTPDQMDAVRAEANDILEDSLKSVGEGFAQALLNGIMDNRAENLLFGRIGIGSTSYGQGLLGEANHDKVAINPGVIRFHSDMYSDEYNTGYGQLLLENIVHELSHTLLNHQGRMDPHSNISPSLRMDNFKTDQSILGYDSDFAAEFEANYVAYNVMSKLGLETSEKAKQRMNQFKQLIDDKGLSSSYNLELADSLVDTLVHENAETLAQIIQFLAPQFDMVKADTNTAQVAEEIRPVITALQSQSEISKESIDEAIKQKQKELQELEDLKKQLFASDDITSVILESWTNMKEATSGRLLLDDFYNHIEQEYNTETRNQAQEWIENAAQNVPKLLTYKNTALSKNKELLPDVVKNWNDKRKQIGAIEVIKLPDSGKFFQLPVHQEFIDNGGEQHEKGFAAKYIHKHSEKDARDFKGIVDILDTDEVRSLSKKDQAYLKRHIYEGSNLGFTIEQLIAADNKLGKGWGVINVTTAMDCLGRMENGLCDFCNKCYAYMQAVRLPELAIKQIGKSLLFDDLSPENFAEILQASKMEVVRVNQEGDFRDLDDYLKTAQIAALLPNTKFYGYTKNLEVLDYIAQNGMLPNYQINNSLGTWETGNYVAAPLSEIADYLEKGYLLCTGACEDCRQCLANMNKVTILRDGTNKVTVNGKQETVSVDDWAHKPREEQIEFFSQFRKNEEKTLKSRGEASKLNAKSFRFLMDAAAAGDMESIALLNQFVNEGVIKKVGNATAYQKTQEQKLTGYQFDDTILYLSKVYKKKNNITDNVSSATKMLDEKQLNRLKRNSVSFIEGNTPAEELKEAIKLNKQYAEEASKYAHIRGVGVQGVNGASSHSYEASYQYGRNAYTDFMNDYLEQGDYLLMNKWDKARHTINESGKHKWMLGIFDTAEKMENGFSAKAQTFQKTSRKYAKDVGDKNLTKVKDIMDNVVNSTSEFKKELSDLAEVFPVLTPLVVGLNAALQVEEQVLTGVNGALNILQFAQGKETNSALLNTIGKMSESSSPIVAAIGDAVSGAVFRAAGMIESALGFIIELGMGPILLIAAGIAAVIAAIKLVQFWEHKHAESLQESQKALEEATAKNNVALSQYQDLKKARESETDAMKKQQKARKEAIALYELEAARIERRKAIHEEAALRNDSIWGEYGLRAKLQKMGLGFIAGGDFESQYENYDGTTKNIRQIKETSLGKLFGGSAEQRYVSSVYDKNSMFFAEVEAYKEPLQELYDKESKLIEKYGSIDIARGTKEFEDAVQEFADATGLNGETAGMMLDWLETENRVNQAAKIGQAEIGIIRARADAAVMGVDAEGAYGLGDMNNLGDAMIVAQFQEMMNTAKTEVWWELLYAYLDTFISILIPWKWGEVYGNLKKVGIRQNELSELDAQGNKILQDMLDNEAERTDYGTSAYSVMNADTPFGAALEASAYNQSGVLTELSTIRRKDSTTPTQKEMLYYQRKISRDTEEINQTNKKSWGERATRLAAHGVGYAAKYAAYRGRPAGAKGVAKKGTELAAHLLNPDEVPMPGKSLLERLGIGSSKNGSKLLTKGESDIIEMIPKGGKYVAKEGAETAAKGGAKALGKTLGELVPWVGPAVTAAFSIAEHNPFEKHYNEDGSEKRALQSTGEVSGEVAGSVAAMGLGLATTAAIEASTLGLGTPIALAVGGLVEMGASLILEPLGKAIGGVLGWLSDELINGLAGAASAVWDGLTNAAGSVWDTVSGTAYGVWDWVTGGITNTASSVVNWLTGNEQQSNDIYNNVKTDNQAPQVVPSGDGGTTIIIKNININTEDDPDKIKDAFMNLMIEMQEQISPRQVSRTIGEPSSASMSTTDANNNNNNPNNDPQVEGQNTNGNNPNPTN